MTHYSTSCEVPQVPLPTEIDWGWALAALLGLLLCALVGLIFRNRPPPRGLAGQLRARREPRRPSGTLSGGPK